MTSSAEALVDNGMITRAECDVFRYADNAEEIWAELVASGNETRDA